MQKILPEAAEPPPKMNPAVVIHNLMEQNAFLQNAMAQQRNISIILAVELFKATKAIQQNVLVAPGYPNLTIVGPLAWMVKQSAIDAIEHLFGAENPPVLDFKQETIGADQALIIRLQSLADAERAVANALN